MSEAWFRFFPSDWIAGTAGLSAAEKGVYVTLLASIYDQGGPIKRDDARLARVCGLPKAAFLRALAALIDGGKIEFDGQCLSNSRSKSELTERENKICAAKEAANARWEKDKKNQVKKNADALNSHSERTAGAMPNECLPQPQPQPHLKNSETKVSAHSNISEEQQRADFYRRGKQILGDGSGGLLTKLLKAKGNIVPRARAALEEASTAGDCREYLGAIIRSKEHKTEQELRDAGEIW